MNGKRTPGGWLTNWRSARIGHIFAAFRNGHAFGRAAPIAEEVEPKSEAPQHELDMDEALYG